MKEMECRSRVDPVDRMIPDCTAAEFTAWLVEYKGVHPECAENVESNLREQFRWHRLQGRLDRSPASAVIAELIGMRAALTKLERPAETSALVDVLIDQLRAELRSAVGSQPGSSEAPRASTEPLST